MTIQPPQWSKAADALAAANRILLVTHVKPDGDAIGSMLGLANALWARGKSVDCAVDGGVPEYLRFISNADRVLNELKSGEWDVMVSLDSSDEARAGDSGVYGRAHSRTVINLDHHPTNTHFGDIFLIVPESVSAAEIVYEWLLKMGDALTLDVAIALMTGLITDTMGFRISSVKPYTLQIAQRLIEAGASMPQIIQRTLNSQDYLVVEVWKRALPTVQLQRRVISAEVRQAHMHELGLTDIPDIGLVSWLVSVNEAVIAVVFKEQPDQKVEISLRCKPGYDVSQVALSLGGGGHKQASGATVAGTLDSVRATVMPLLYAAAALASTADAL